MNKFQTLSPLEDRVLVKPIKRGEEKTDAGIVIPETAKTEVIEAEVIAVGVGRYAIENGLFIANVLNKGDMVLIPANHGLPLDVIDGDSKIEVKMMREGDVLMLIGRKEK